MLQPSASVRSQSPDVHDYVLLPPCEIVSQSNTGVDPDCSYVRLRLGGCRVPKRSVGSRCSIFSEIFTVAGNSSSAHRRQANFQTSKELDILGTFDKRLGREVPKRTCR